MYMLWMRPMPPAKYKKQDQSKHKAALCYIAAGLQVCLTAGVPRVVPAPAAQGVKTPSIMGPPVLIFLE